MILKIYLITVAFSTLLLLLFILRIFSVLLQMKKAKKLKESKKTFFEKIISHLIFIFTFLAVVSIPILNFLITFILAFRITDKEIKEKIEEEA